MMFRVHRLSVTVIALLAGLSATRSARAATLTVGPGKMYAKPCAAVAASADGDTIEIDAAGVYDGDVCSIAKNRLTLRGVAGRPKINAAGMNAGGKGIWVISGTDTIVENIEFSGATVPDQNGAGIRQEGNNLTVRRCYFHDNENGILSGAGANSEILIENSEFASNGFGDGYSHNMYIGNVKRFTLRFSYSHGAKVGHLVKSRAAENYILYNRLSGEDGTASYELDLPNAGTSYVIGNLIQQGASTQNPTFMTYGVEGLVPENPGHALFVVNNTFVNDRSAGGSFINVASAVTDAAIIKNNIFTGVGTIINQATAMQTTNFAQADALFVNAAAYDYHLRSGSPCINAGSDPGTGLGFALTPTSQYVHPASAEGRLAQGTIDIGAYELGGGSDAGVDASAPRDGSIDVASDGSTRDAPSSRDGSAGAGGGPVNDAGQGGSTTGGAGGAAGGVSGGAGGSSGASGASAGAAGSPADPSAPVDSSGCGCRTVAHRRDASATPIAAALMLMLAFRRRRASLRVGRG